MRAVSSQEDIAGTFGSGIVPQFGDFEDERLSRRDSGVCLKVIIKNTFLDIDDQPPTPLKLARARTAPAGYTQERGDYEFSDVLSPVRMGEFAMSRCPTHDSEEATGPAWRGGTSSFECSSPAQGSAVQPSVAGLPPGAAAGAAQGAPSSQMVYDGQPMQMVMMQMDMHAMGNGTTQVQSPLQQQRVPQQQEQQKQQAMRPYPPLQPQPPQQPLPAGTRQRRPLPEMQAGFHQEIPAVLEQHGGASGSGAPGIAAPHPQPQTLESETDGKGLWRVHWTVDARKLRGNDKGAVSPPFALSFGPAAPEVTFKLMLYPKVVHDAKGGSSFKRAHGKGCVQLKCEEGLPTHIADVQYRISIATTRGVNATESRGPVAHNFSNNAVCGLPKDQEEWNFLSVVEANSQTFVVRLELAIVHFYQGRELPWSPSSAA